MKPQLALTVLALACSKPEIDLKTGSKNGTQERSRVCHCNECDEPVANTLQPSEDAVPFCEELAKVRNDAIKTVTGKKSTTRSAQFEQPVNEYFHKAGTVTCGYSELLRSMTGAQRIRVASIFIEEADVGNPDGAHHRFWDDHVQDHAGTPQRSGADGILDRNFGGDYYGGCNWGPTDRTFDLIQREYSERMRFLRNQLRAGQLLPSARARNGR